MSQKRGGYAYHNGLQAKLGLQGAVLFEYYFYQEDKAKTWPQPALSDAISMLQPRSMMTLAASMIAFLVYFMLCMTYWNWLEWYQNRWQYDTL